MYAIIQKWGNSHAIRIPKGILVLSNFHENDKVEIEADDNQIIIKHIQKKHLTLKERFEGYTGDYNIEEWDTGKPVGKEIW